MTIVFVLRLIDRRYPERESRSANLTALAGDIAILWLAVFVILSLASVAS